MLKPGALIVEGTAGNTGIGLALVGNARGYRTVIVTVSSVRSAPRHAGRVGMFLKEPRRKIRIAAADPMGAAMYHWIKHDGGEMLRDAPG